MANIKIIIFLKQRTALLFTRFANCYQNYVPGEGMGPGWERVRGFEGFLKAKPTEVTIGRLAKRDSMVVHLDQVLEVHYH